jgi:hypothetical protein
MDSYSFKFRFRLAACLLIELSHCQWKDELDEKLQNLPKDLFGMYDRFLDSQRFRPEDLGYVASVLRWIFSARTMTLAELADAIAFKFESDPVRHIYCPDRRKDRDAKFSLSTAMRSPSGTLNIPLNSAARRTSDISVAAVVR